MLTPYDQYKTSYPEAWDDDRMEHLTFEELLQAGFYEEIEPTPSALWLAGFIEDDEMQAAFNLDAIQLSEIVFGPVQA